MSNAVRGRAVSSLEKSRGEEMARLVLVKILVRVAGWVCGLR